MQEVFINNAQLFPQCIPNSLDRDGSPRIRVLCILACWLVYATNIHYDNIVLHANVNLKTLVIQVVVVGLSPSARCKNEFNISVLDLLAQGRPDFSPAPWRFVIMKHLY
jgi:hypothetical protein